MNPKDQRVIPQCRAHGDPGLPSDVAALHPEASFPKPLALAKLRG